MASALSQLQPMCPNCYRSFRYSITTGCTRVDEGYAAINNERLTTPIEIYCACGVKVLARFFATQAEQL